MAETQLHLLQERRFLPLFITQFLGAVNDNLLKTALVTLITYKAFTDPATMPGWLGAIAEWNPLSATVAAARSLFGNPGWGGDSWAATHAVELALAWPLVLSAIFFPLAVARYRALSGGP